MVEAPKEKPFWETVHRVERLGRTVEWVRRHWAPGGWFYHHRIGEDHDFITFVPVETPTSVTPSFRFELPAGWPPHPPAVAFRAVNEK